MKYLNTLIFITICYNAGLCQSDWKDGYIITQENDTLHGQINHLAYRTMGEECRFRSAPKSPAISSFPKDIKGYVITNFAYYVSKEIDDKNMVFLEYLVNGKLDLFYIRSNDVDRYFIQNDSLPLKEIKYDEEIKNVNGVNYVFESKKHVGLISLYTKDAPQLYKRIVNIKNDFHNLKRFTVDYHNIVCKDTLCITYRNREAYTKIAIGPHLGQLTQSYFDGKSYVNGSYLAYGILIRVWSPRINKNLFFKTGALVSNIDTYNFSIDQPTKMRTIVKIPIQLEYVLPISFIVKPKASFGFVLFTNSDLYLNASIGADVAISKMVCLSFGYDKSITGIGGLGFGQRFNESIVGGAFFQF
jgi:hypothetical protein